MVTAHNQTCDHFEMFRNTESLCCITETNSVVGQSSSKTNSQEKRSVLRLPEESWRGGGQDEGGQKVQALSYKIKNTRDVMYNTINIMNAALCYMQKQLRLRE